MIAITSSGASETDSARKRCAGRRSQTWRITSSPPPPGMCTSSSTTSGSRSTISGTASSTLAASADDVHEPVELRAHARAEQRVVVDDHDARHGSITSSTSVPCPGVLWTLARPPWRSMRATIESRTPRRSAGTASGSKPGPRSRTNTSARPSSTSA